MMLLLLIILAVLIWSIQRELEPKKCPVDPTTLDCPACRHSIDFDSIFCPHCRQQLRETCVDCHQGKMISHRYCPFCGSEQGRG